MHFNCIWLSYDIVNTTFNKRYLFLVNHILVPLNAKNTVLCIAICLQLCDVHNSVSNACLLPLRIASFFHVQETIHCMKTLPLKALYIKPKYGDELKMEKTKVVMYEMFLCKKVILIYHIIYKIYAITRTSRYQCNHRWYREEIGVYCKYVARLFFIAPCPKSVLSVAKNPQ